MTRRAAIYVRLSRHRGADDPSTSPERQREACQAYADAQGWGVVDVVEDLDVSGGEGGLRLDRPGLRQLRDRFAEIDVLIFLKLDRLARSVADFSTFASEARDHGVDLVSVRDGLDLSTPGGRFVAQILAAFAEMELATITERIRDGKRKARELGRYPGGGVHFGLRVEDGFLVVDEDEAEALAEAADDLLSGGSIRRSAALLGASGHTPRRSAHWSRKTTKRVLTSSYAPTLLGVERAHLVAEALADNSRPATTNPKRLLSGLLRCHACGTVLHVNARTSGEDVYRCGSRSAGRPCSAPVAVLAEPIERWVESDFLAEFGDHDETIPVRVADERTAEVAALSAEIALRADALATLPRSARRAALDDLDELEDRLAALRSTPGYGRAIFRRTGRTARESWAAADLDERREILRGRLTVHGGHLIIGPGRRGGRGFDPRRILSAWSSSAPAGGTPER